MEIYYYIESTQGYETKLQKQKWIKCAVVAGPETV